MFICLGYNRLQLSHCNPKATGKLFEASTDQREPQLCRYYAKIVTDSNAVPLTRRKSNRVIILVKLDLRVGENRQRFQGGSKSYLRPKMSTFFLFIVILYLNPYGEKKTSHRVSAAILKQDRSAYISMKYLITKVRDFEGRQHKADDACRWVFFTRIAIKPFHCRESTHPMCYLVCEYISFVSVRLLYSA